ncbi:MAG: aminofutalosine synthase MqnE [Saprospiraceae bacterium]|jgi:aminodeoxyfutalosine synthase|nr:aminofutalosine synthase MqnE [Saprospiraceae bacterium]
MDTNIDILLSGTYSDQSIERRLVEKVKANQRITPEEGLWLYENAELSFVSMLADFVRKRKNGLNTFFNRNFHIEPTNLCVYSCSFCSYSRLIKQRHEGWEYTHDDMMEMVKKYDDQPVTEVHIVGGVLPQYDLAFYTKLFKEIKKHRPELHIKALTPVEYHYIFKKAKVSYKEGLEQIIASGVESMPGGGAEIFDEEIRDKIAGGKCSTAQWLEMHEIWHGLGKKSNATMLYGHIETYAHRIDHLDRLRSLQDKTGGFQTFIPLKFRNKDNEMSYLPECSVIEDLKNYAISRIYLDNFDHIKAYWPMIGRTVAQLSLNCGVDDLDGTIDDTTKIYSMAGSEEQNPAMSTKDLVMLIRETGFKPLERDTLYNIMNDFSETVFEEDEFKGYLSLPVVNNN